MLAGGAVSYDVLIALVCIVLYGGALSRFIPDRFHFPANIVASVVAVLYGLWNGLDFTSMGMGAHFVLKGVAVAMLVSLGVMCLAAIIALSKPLQRFITAPQIIRPGKIAYETAVRIPLSTALSEEILFRGVLLGLLLQNYSTLTSLAVAGVFFGIWHALPSIRDHSKHAALPIIFATSLAGVFFGWLRLIAGSIVAPWLVHWSINASALLALRVLHKRQDILLSKSDTKS